MTLDEIFAEAARRGLLLNNCFQFGPANTFRANWRDDRGGHPFGEAATAQDALRKALDAVPPPTTKSEFDLL